MSWAAIVWARGLCQVAPPLRVVLYELAFLANDVGEARAAQGSISARTGIRLRSLNRYLVKLDNLGLVTRLRQVNPTNGRNAPTRYVLAISSAKVDAAKYTPNRDHSGRRRVPNRAPAVCQSFGTESDSRTNIPPSPQESSFEDLVRAWGDRPIGNNRRLRFRFAELSEEDRQSAIANCDLTRRVLYARKSNMSLDAYLRSRTFELFDGSLSFDSAGHWVIRPGAPEWSAWLDHYQQQGPTVAIAEMQRLGKLLRVDRWPPGHPKPTNRFRPMPTGNEIPNGRKDREDAPP